MVNVVNITSIPCHKNVSFFFEQKPKGKELLKRISNLFPSSSIFGSSIEEIGYLSDGYKIYRSEDYIESENSFLQFHIRIRGGKQGAFGQTLKRKKIMGKKIVSLSKCKDLSGRRIADIKLEKIIDELKARQVEKNKEPVSLKDKLDLYKEKGKRYVNLDDFEEKIKKSTESFEDALDKGLKEKEVEDEKESDEVEILKESDNSKDSNEEENKPLPFDTFSFD